MDAKKIAEVEKTMSKSLLIRLSEEFGFIRGNFLIMVLSWLILDFAGEMPSTYYPKYVEALGGTAAIIGLIGAAELVARALVQIPGGYLADKYGRKWLIFTMTFFAGVARVFYVFAPSWEWILVGAIMGGFAGIYQPALNAIIADSVPKEKRGMGFSIIQLIAGASTTPAPLIAGYLYTKMGLVPSVRLSYIIVVIGFLAASALRTRLKETVENPAKINLTEMLGSYSSSLKESISVWKVVPRGAFVIFLVFIAVNFTSGLFQPVLTLYILDDLGIDYVAFSYIMTTLFVSMIILALPAGKLIDKIGKKKPILAAFVIWGMAVPLLIWGDFYRIIVSMTLVGLIQVLVNGATSALTADLVPREHRGKVNGSRGFFSMIALSLGMFAGGWLYDNVGHQIPFLLQFVLIIPPILLVYFFIEEPKEEEINGA
ncbi:MAG: MFS transporter [Candidatus Bathyarchaeota archaeon]|nr:MFS transporter [Candidatus Bathyarchaeota archaeon]